MRRRRGDGQSLSAEGGATWARLAVAGRFGRRGARGSIVSTRRAGARRIRPDCAYIHRELKRDSVTLQLLWEEYAQIHPDGYGRNPVLRDLPAMDAAAAAVDAAGAPRRREDVHRLFRQAASLVDRRTGELRRVELFVAVLGASSLTYAAATETQHTATLVSGSRIADQKGDRDRSTRALAEDLTTLAARTLALGAADCRAG